MNKSMKVKIVDLKTQRQVGKDYKYGNRNWARARAERLNLEYGAYRYVAKLVWSEAGQTNLYGLIAIGYILFLVIIAIVLF